jgi:ketosteroid isomerase-like protein
LIIPRAKAKQEDEEPKLLYLGVDLQQTVAMNQQLTHLLTEAYSSFAQGDWQKFLKQFPDSMTFQVAGKSKLAGKLTKETFSTRYGQMLQELSNGTFKVEIHDVMTTDRHATVLMTCKLSRSGKSYELRSVHVWRTENGIPIAGYEYPRDLYQFDEAWG